MVLLYRIYKPLQHRSFATFTAPVPHILQCDPPQKRKATKIERKIFLDFILNIFLNYLHDKHTHRPRHLADAAETLAATCFPRDKAVDTRAMLTQLRATMLEFSPNAGPLSHTGCPVGGAGGGAGLPLPHRGA